MREVWKFICFVVPVLAAGALILTGLSLADAGKMQRADMAFDRNRHILVYGPSTCAYSIDDSILDCAKNVSREGTDIFLLEPVLPVILDQNPQVDTVLVYYGRYAMGAPRDFSSVGSDVIMNMHDFIMQPGTDDRIKAELRRNPEFYLDLFHPDITRLINRHPDAAYYGLGYIDLPHDVCHLHDPSKVWSIPEREQIAKANPVAHRAYDPSEHQLMKDALLRAIDTCRARGIEPVLFMTPLYQYHRWSSWTGIVTELSGLEDDGLLVADYEDFAFPDDTYYADIIHLNGKGAAYLSHHIKRHGLQTEPLADWLVSKRDSL